MNVYLFYNFKFNFGCLLKETFFLQVSFLNFLYYFLFQYLHHSKYVILILHYFFIKKITTTNDLLYYLKDFFNYPFFSNFQFILLLHHPEMDLYLINFNNFLHIFLIIFNQGFWVNEIKEEVIRSRWIHKNYLLTLPILINFIFNVFQLYHKYFIYDEVSLLYLTHTY